MVIFYSYVKLPEGSQQAFWNAESWFKPTHDIRQDRVAQLISGVGDHETTGSSNILQQFLYSNGHVMSSLDSC